MKFTIILIINIFLSTFVFAQSEDWYMHLTYLHPDLERVDVYIDSKLDHSMPVIQVDNLDDPKIDILKFLKEDKGQLVKFNNNYIEKKDYTNGVAPFTHRFYFENDKIIKIEEFKKRGQFNTLEVNYKYKNGLLLEEEVSHYDGSKRKLVYEYINNDLSYIHYTSPNNYFFNTGKTVTKVKQINKTDYVETPAPDHLFLLPEANTLYDKKIHKEYYDNDIFIIENNYYFKDHDKVWMIETFKSKDGYFLERRINVPARYTIIETYIYKNYKNPIIPKLEDLQKKYSEYYTTVAELPLLSKPNYNNSENVFLSKPGEKLKYIKSFKEEWLLLENNDGIKGWIRKPFLIELNNE